MYMYVISSANINRVTNNDITYMGNNHNSNNNADDNDNDYENNQNNNKLW